MSDEIPFDPNEADKQSNEKVEVDTGDSPVVKDPQKDKELEEQIQQQLEEDESKIVDIRKYLKTLPDAKTDDQDSTVIPKDFPAKEEEENESVDQLLDRMNTIDRNEDLSPEEKEKQLQSIKEKIDALSSKPPENTNQQNENGGSNQDDQAEQSNGDDLNETSEEETDVEDVQEKYRKEAGLDEEPAGQPSQEGTVTSTAGEEDATDAGPPAEEEPAIGTPEDVAQVEAEQKIDWQEEAKKLPIWKKIAKAGWMWAFVGPIVKKDFWARKLEKEHNDRMLKKERKAAKKIRTDDERIDRIRQILDEDQED